MWVPLEFCCDPLEFQLIGKMCWKENVRELVASISVPKLIVNICKFLWITLKKHTYFKNTCIHVNN